MIVKKYKYNGFTLVELIVVITILSILGTISYVAMQGYSSGARDAKRVSDIELIQKALELYSLNTLKYPLPDNPQEVTYDVDLVWTQGIIGNTIVKNLSKNLNYLPLDPLTNLEYIYSVDSSRKEYELLSIYESDMVSYNSDSKILNKTNASNKSYPKTDGNYNGLFVKTKSYYIPVPSIITSEDISLGITLNGTNITSQVITGGENVVQYGTTERQINKLNNLKLSVYTGSIYYNSSQEKKLTFINTLKTAYSGTILENNGIYKEIILSSNNEDSIKIINSLVGKNESNNIEHGVCGTDNGQGFFTNPVNLCNSGNSSIVTDNGAGSTYAWSCNGENGGLNVSCNANHLRLSSRYPGCNEDDIPVGSFTIAACNIGSSTAGTTAASYGSYFQWGNNTPLVSGGASSTVQVDASSNGPSNYYNNAVFIKGNIGFEDWSSFQNDNLWGETDATSISRKGPCEAGYHIPAYTEWTGITSAGGRTSNYSAMNSNLKLSFNGNLSWMTGVATNIGLFGGYWTTTPYLTNKAKSLVPSSFGNFYTNYERTTGLSIRCFKN